MVSAETLFKGSWYALEQSGRLLRSAVLIYDHGDNSTAVALSMFGREELGRSRILRKLAKRVIDGDHLTPENVQSACENHVSKQASGSLSTTLRTQAPNQLDAALRKRMKVPPGSEKWQQASKTVDLATEAKRKRQPQDRHEMRENALYVDLDTSGTAWRRPSTLDSTKCYHEITDAMNDYAVEQDRLRDEVVDEDFPDMASARAKMDRKVILPKPCWRKNMDEKTQKVFRDLDEGTRLLKGEWTSDGRKLFNFEVIEIEIHNSCGLKVDTKEIVSGLRYFLQGKGNPNAMIYVNKGIENSDREVEEKNGIGTFFFYMTDDDKQKAQIEIVLHPDAFEDFIHTITILRFKGKLKFRVIVKKIPGEKTDDVLMVSSYELENFLQV